MPRDIPQLFENLLPEAEREACKHLSWLLGLLDGHRSHFTAALNLMMECNEAIQGRISAIRPINRQVYNTPDFEIVPHSRVASQWERIAMKDAAMSIYNFGRTLDGIKKTTWKCPTLRKAVDLDKLDTAQPLYEKYFPKAARIRTAVAHLGDVSHSRVSLAKARYDSPVKIAGEAFSGIAGGVIIHNWCIHMTIQNDLVTVEVSPTKHAQMIEIVGVVYDAFSDHLKKLLEVLKRDATSGSKKTDHQ